MDKNNIFELSLEMDIFFASLPNSQSEIIAAALNLIAYKLKDTHSAASKNLMELASDLYDLNDTGTP